ncbi:prolipoprotein diacylglyceryl transferase [Opitutales bacterium]|nr:prolipoprotein diacylglyceryl transferase [Opitutales bacterium]MDA8990668.1 prolipoprotein diacylglyceryl transferase [Opitutales bacterium]
MISILANSNYWLHDLSPFIWEFPGDFAHWGPGGIRWYGISYLLGFVSAYLLLLKYFKCKRSPYDQDQVMNLMTFQVIGVLIGGRVGYLLLYQGEKFITDPLSIFRVWEGGMASHGGFIGVFLATLWYANRSGQNIKPIGDLIVSVVPPGLCFGRIANFINGELWGRTTQVEWGVLFPKSPDFALGIARHPSQLYAAVLEGFLPFCFVQWRFWRSSITSKYPGHLAGEFLIFYAIARILNEFFREPDASLLAGMTRGQFYSLFLFIAGIGVIYWARKSRSLPQEGSK